jgi:nicotinamidase-related amidase
MRIDPARSALVIVDMQNDFCDADGYYCRAGRDVSVLAGAIEPVTALLARARDAGLTIVFTRLVHDMARGAMEERHELRPKRWTASGKRLLPGSWGAEVVAALRPLEGEIVIDKAGYSAFDDTGLEAELKRRNVKTLILCGVVTYACVLATGFSAFDRGFDVVLAQEAAGSWKPELGSATEEIVDLLLGHTVSTSEIEFAEHAFAK